MEDALLASPKQTVNTKQAVCLTIGMSLFSLCNGCDFLEQNNRWQ